MIRRALAGSVWAASALAALALLALAGGAAGAPARSLEDIKWVPATLPTATVGRGYGIVDMFGDKGQGRGRDITIADPPRCPGDNGDFEACHAMAPKGMEIGAPGGNFSGYTLQGTPEQPGPFTLTFNFLDNDTPPGVPPRAVSHTWTLVVEPAKPKGGLTVSPAPHELPSGHVGKDYRQRFTVEGGVPPYAFGVRGLPPGMKLTADGILSGTPKLPGDYRFTLVVRDSEKSRKKVSYVLSVSEIGADLEVKVEHGQESVVVTRGPGKEGHLLRRAVRARYVVVVTNHGPQDTAARLIISWEASRPVFRPRTTAQGDGCSKTNTGAQTTCSWAGLDRGESRRVTVTATFPKVSQGFEDVETSKALLEGKSFTLELYVEGSAQPDPQKDKPNRASFTTRVERQG